MKETEKEPLYPCDNWAKDFGWTDNPFNLRVQEDEYLLINNNETTNLIEEINEFTNKDTYFIVIHGDKETGKTTLLNHLHARLRTHETTKLDFLNIIKNEKLKQFEYTLIEPFLTKLEKFKIKNNTNIHETKFLIEKFDNKKHYIFIDNMQYSSTNQWESLKSITKYFRINIVITTNYPQFFEINKFLKPYEGHYFQKIELKTTTQISIEETYKLLKSRISYYQNQPTYMGSGYQPLTPEYIKYIHKNSNGEIKKILKLTETIIKRIYKGETPIQETQQIIKIYKSTKNKSIKKQKSPNTKENNDKPLIIQTQNNIETQKIPKKEIHSPFYYRKVHKRRKRKNGKIWEGYYWELRRTWRDPVNRKKIHHKSEKHLGPAELSQTEPTEEQKQTAKIHIENLKEKKENKPETQTIDEPKETINTPKIIQQYTLLQKEQTENKPKKRTNKVSIYDLVNALEKERDKKYKEAIKLNKPKDTLLPPAYFYKKTNIKRKLKDNTQKEYSYWELRKTIREPNNYKKIKVLHILHLGKANPEETEPNEEQKEKAKKYLENINKNP